MKWMRIYGQNIRLGYAVLLAMLVFALGLVAGSLTVILNSAPSDTDQAFEAFWDAYSIIQERYIDPIEIETLVDGAISGMVAALKDEHSGYIRPELFKRSTDFSGKFTGIGVFAKTGVDSGAPTVASVIPESPAAAAGVLPGDIFFEVDGQRVAGFTQTELTAIMQGPRGTAVAITFKRDDKFVAFEIIRETLALPNVSYEILGDNIAYIAMRDFHDLSRGQLDDALEALDINRSAGLIFDIRDNPGGTLASAVEIGSAFIEDGALLRQVARDQAEEITRTSGGYAGLKVPIVVLVDETSASASEVIAGAMQDHGVAIIMGETTFGKGTVQNIPPLANGGGLRITVGRWLTPNGNWIHRQGITPDIVVEGDAAAGAGGDAQLDAAIAYLQSLRD